ncbi:ABC transporter permease [Pseudonocardia sp. GCM10023141]|uniref:ABC transporter permease n=1 Tax=Pseudonocardia sp. GCM10023141 TaxID=3252653 RepID=UPI00360F8067
MTALTEAPPDTRTAGAAVAPEHGPERHRRMTTSARIASGVVVLIAAVAMVGPLLVGDPNAGDVAHRLLPSGSAGHLLGTDGQGRDVLARLVVGTRLSLLAGLVPVLFAAVVGTGLGVTAGLSGAWGHRLIMRTLDVFYAFPAVLLAIAIAAALGSGISNSIIALAVILVRRSRGWPRPRPAGSSISTTWRLREPAAPPGSPSPRARCCPTSPRPSSSTALL